MTSIIWFVPEVSRLRQYSNSNESSRTDTTQAETKHSGHRRWIRQVWTHTTRKILSSRKVFTWRPRTCYQLCYGLMRRWGKGKKQVRSDWPSPCGWYAVVKCCMTLTRVKIACHSSLGNFLSRSEILFLGNPQLAVTRNVMRSGEQSAQRQ